MDDDLWPARCASREERCESPQRRGVRLERQAEPASDGPRWCRALAAVSLATVEQISVDTTAVAVLADGGSPAEISNRRGHLLEAFIARLLAVLGYEEPRTEHLNVTSDGVELDVIARARVTGQMLMAECKAYTANVAAPHLTSFVGKYLLRKADDAQLAGWFVALPRLTAEAKEQADEVAGKFPLFRYLGSFDVCELLMKADLLPPLTAGPELHADLTVVITEHGLALAARELDPRTRRATRVMLWNRTETVPDPLRELVERSRLAEGLPVAARGNQAVSVPVRNGHEPAIVAVRGSTSDFEYQLPASPKFFVGRKAVAAGLLQSIQTRKEGGVLVINAKSGWGKSSLALHLESKVQQAGGVAQVIDTRTAESADFVAAAVEGLVRKAVQRRLLRLSSEAAFSSLSSSVRSLGGAVWRRDRPLLLFFDQFENVFRSETLTREFRDLTSLIGELEVPVTVGFAWKTDLVGWTEDHPYRLRDDIRQAAYVSVLEPLGPREIETLLRRLEKAVGDKLQRELRRRLREYSQGLPWLFKKLAGHILAELDGGLSQDELVRESLNVQSLFESDLAELTPQEQEGVRTIARSAPALVSDLEETVPTAIVQSLINRRLVVQVGDRVDTYWDTFRDFLLTGRVAIEDSYIIRYGPASVAKLLRRLISGGGELTVTQAAQELGTSATVIFNLSRELRLMGLVATEPNRLVVDPAILNSPDPEGACRELVARALRRHKVLGVVSRELDSAGQSIPFSRVAAELPASFPAVEANSESWLTYARAFCQWLAYGGLLALSRDGVRQLGPDELPQHQLYLLSGAVPVRVQGAFPQSAAGPAEQLLIHLADPTAPRPEGRRLRGAMRDLSLLGAIVLDEHDRVTLSPPDLATGAGVSEAVLRRLVRGMPGCDEAFKALQTDPATPPARLGEILREAHGAEWTAMTAHSVGKYIRSWARLCGLQTRAKRGVTASTSRRPTIATGDGQQEIPNL